MIVALLLKASGLTALLVAYIAGLILFSIQLFVDDFSLVYMLSTVSGFADFLIPLLFTYGREWLYAIGAWSHLVQVVGVFCIVVKNYGHTAFNVITFYSTWAIIGAYLAADIRALYYKSPIRLELNTEDGPVNDLNPSEASDNPLHKVDVPKKTLYIMIAGSIIGAIISANIFVFVVARD